MDEVYFDGLSVILAHFLDSDFVNWLTIFIRKSAQKHRKLLSNEIDHFRFLDPGSQVFLVFAIVIDVAHVLLLKAIIHGSLPHLEHLSLGVITIAHLIESLSLAHLSPIFHAAEHVVLTFSKSSCLSVDHLLLVVVDAALIVAVKLGSRLVVLVNVIVEVVA